MSPKRDQSGQALVLTVVFLVSLLGMAALVLDVGSWYRAKRQLQSTADAAALAGAQALPRAPGNATSLAQQYATKKHPTSPRTTSPPPDTSARTTRVAATGPAPPPAF